MPEYRVCAVIVAYNPGAALVENIAALFPQVARLVIVAVTPVRAGPVLLRTAVYV